MPKAAKKVIEIEFRNGDTSIVRTITTGAKELPLSKVLGTALNDLFRLVDLQSKKAVKLFKFSQPFELRVSCEGVVIDTTKIQSELKTNFKLNASPTRKRNFAKSVFAVLEVATSQTRVCEVTTVINKCEKDIANEKVTVKQVEKILVGTPVVDVKVE